MYFLKKVEHKRGMNMRDRHLNSWDRRVQLLLICPGYPLDKPPKNSRKQLFLDESINELNQQETELKMTKMSGAQALLESLERQKVEVIFGILGGAILPVYDALCGNRKIRHILARHEQCAAHEAEGYARASGRAAYAWQQAVQEPPT